MRNCSESRGPASNEMKQFKAYATAALAVLATVLLAGCAHVRSQSKPPARTVANFKARTLDDQGLKQFLEQHLRHSLETWPLESWDFPKLTLAALYFHPELAAPQTQRRTQRDSKVEHPADSARLRTAAVAWQVRATLRTNLLAYVAVQRRQELLRELESTQMELAQVVAKRLADGELPPVELSLLRIQLAETRLEMIESFQKKMNFRERMADSLGLSVKALFEVEVTYDLSRAARHDLDARTLRRQALRSRADVLLAVSEYTAAEMTLRREISKRHPKARLNPGCAWDAEQNRWAINLKPDLLTNYNSGQIATMEARRIEAAAHLLNLQTEVIDELDRQAALYRARLEDAGDIGRLTAAIRRQHDAVEARFKARDALRLELIMARLQLLPAQVAQLDAQERLQEALGALEDAAHLPSDWTDSSMEVEPERPARTPPVKPNPAIIPKDAI